MYNYGHYLRVIEYAEDEYDYEVIHKYNCPIDWTFYTWLILEEKDTFTHLIGGEGNLWNKVRIIDDVFSPDWHYVCYVQFELDNVGLDATRGLKRT